MILLALGVVLFAVLHLIPALPPAKAALVGRVGEKAYGPLYGSASVLALALIVAGWRWSPFIPVYEPASWGRYANYGMTLVAFLCLGIFLFRGKLRQTLRFPMGLAVLFWGTGHLLANGDLAGLILFGGFLAYALLHIAIGVAQGVRPSPDVRGGHDLLSLLAGVALYGVMTQLHPVLIGVPIYIPGQ
jgi:uncharacterized membrane protein